MPNKLLEELAESGDPAFQFVVGLFYLNGFNGVRSVSRARDFLLKSAKQGLLASQYSLSLVPHGSDAEKKEALAWLERAANSGYAAAQLHLGVHFEIGTIVEKNDELALQWMKSAADQDHLPAIAYLGVKYSKGLGVEADQVMALKYLSTAAERGHRNSAFLLGGILLRQQDQNSVLEGLRWIKISAAGGHPNANGLLASVYASGLYGQQRDTDLSALFEKRAQLSMDDWEGI